MCSIISVCQSNIVEFRERLYFEEALKVCMSPGTVARPIRVDDSAGSLSRNSEIQLRMAIPI